MAAEELQITECCFYCLADVAIDPKAKYVLLSKASDSTGATAGQPRSISHLICFQVATRKVRNNEWGFSPADELADG